MYHVCEDFGGQCWNWDIGKSQALGEFVPVLALCQNWAPSAGTRTWQYPSFGTGRPVSALGTQCQYWTMTFVPP